MIADNNFTFNTMALVAIVCLLTDNVEAFAPIHNPSVARSIVPSSFPTYNPASTTALQANLFDRFLRVSKANVNNALDRMEDPEKVINQAVEDMQNDLVRVRQTYAEVTAAQRRLAGSKKHLESQAKDWYDRAQLALRKENEGLAKEALSRREALLNQAKSIQDQIDGQTKNIDALYEGMKALEQKITEASSKKDQMKARARTAKTTQKINDMVSGLTGKTSMDAFNRMEEKVLALETAAEVSGDMARNSMNKPLLQSSSDKYLTSDTEMKFRMLEASDSVEKELEKLKEEAGFQ